jgi:hypothetical protein
MALADVRASVPPPSPGAPGSPPPGALHELRTLVLSRHPAIVIETREEERADALVAAVARQSGLEVFEWTVTRGLVRRPAGAPVYGTEDPVRMLAAIGDLEVQGLFVLKDVSPHLTAPVVSRALRELLERFAAPGRLSTVVLLGAAVSVPPDLDGQVVRYELRLPDREEYRSAVAAVVESLQANRRAEVVLAPEDVDAFADAMTGLTLNQARQLLAQVAIDDGRLDAGDVGRVLELKARALREDSLLEYFPAADNPYELGSFANLRRWLGRAQLARGPEAAALNLPTPKGIMLVGVQGCGKSLAAKVIAREWGLPPAQAGRRTAVRRVRRRVRAQPPARVRRRRVDGASGAVDRRDREGHDAGGRRRRR